MSWCIDCPRMDFTDEDLAKIRERVPEFELREVCCMEAAERLEQMPDDLAHALKMREIERQEVYRGAPRNRHERRAAAKKARA